jgi:hypothetical protein
MLQKLRTLLWYITVSYVISASHIKWPWRRSHLTSSRVSQVVIPGHWNGERNAGRFNSTSCLRSWREEKYAQGQLVNKSYVWLLYLPLVLTLRTLQFTNTETTNSVAFSPQVIYTDWATATCWRNLVPTFADRVVSRGQRGGSPTVVNLSFLDRSRYFSFKYLLIYPHNGWVDPVPDPPLLRKSGSAGNRTRELRVCSQEVWPLDNRSDSVYIYSP